MLVAFAIYLVEIRVVVQKIQCFEMDFQTNEHDMYLAIAGSFFHDVFYVYYKEMVYEVDDDLYKTIYHMKLHVRTIRSLWI
jgi:hypothetical protein